MNKIFVVNKINITKPSIGQAYNKIIKARLLGVLLTSALFLATRPQASTDKTDVTLEAML